MIDRFGDEALYKTDFPAYRKAAPLRRDRRPAGPSHYQRRGGSPSFSPSGRENFCSFYTRYRTLIAFFLDLLMPDHEVGPCGDCSADGQHPLRRYSHLSVSPCLLEGI